MTLDVCYKKNRRVKLNIDKFINKLVTLGICSKTTIDAESQHFKVLDIYVVIHN